MKMPAICRIITAITLWAILIAATAATAATIAVNIQGFAFTPQNLTINVGDTVVWTQNDATTHTVTSTASPFDLNSGNLSQTSTYSHTFNSAGSFPYRCNIHTSMTGSITVQAVTSLTNGLIAYYPFNGNANDASGSGYHLTPVGAPRYSGLDRFGQTNASVDLSGGANYFFLNQVAPAAFATAPFTVTFWRKGNGADTAIAIEDGGTGLYGIGGTGDNVRVDENVGLSGSRTPFNFTSGISSAQWNAVVLVWNGSQSAAYVNGRLLGTSSLPTPANILSTHRFYVGADSYAGFEYYDGQLDDIRIYNRALSANEVTHLYALESISPFPNTAVWNWTELSPATTVPANFHPVPSAVDYTRGLAYSAWKGSGQPGALIVYNMASNTFLTLPANGGPNEIYAYVFDPVGNRILAWQDGRGTVYAIPAAGGTWQALGGGGQSATDYGNTEWWNPVSGKINTFGGYGLFAYRNWEWEFNPTNGTWTQLAAATAGSLSDFSRPWPRSGFWSQTPDVANGRMFFWGGDGNSSGNQFQLDSGYPGWVLDIYGNPYSSEILEDLWQFDLTTRQWTSLIRVTNHEPNWGANGIAYYPPRNSIVMVQGQLPPANNGQFTNAVMEYRLGIDTQFSAVTTTGTTPALPSVAGATLPVPIYDAARQRIVCFSQAGVYSLAEVPAASIPPGIANQPTNLVSSVGNSVTFSVTATGSTPLAFQWRKGGANLTGATSATLVLSGVQTNQAGNYTVVITNTWGSITSSVVSLTVNRLGQSITFGSLATKLVGDPTFTLGEFASSGLAITYGSANPAVATVSGNTVTIVGAGTTVITANQAGNATYLAAASVSQTLTVNTPPPGGPPEPVGSLPTATVSVFAGSGVAGNVNGPDLQAIQLSYPNGLGFLSSGILIVADVGNNQLRLIYPPSVASFGSAPYAGSGVAGYLDSVDSAQARLNTPHGMFVGPGDDVFVADTQNNRIRRVSPNSTRTVSTVAGSGAIGLIDGAGGSASFNFPNDLVMDGNGNLFVTEFNNHVIRKITPGGNVSIFAGAGVAGTADGQGTAARFNGPGGIARGADGTLYVNEYLGNRVRKITPDGLVTTIAGDGVGGLRDGVGIAARFNNPDGITVDSHGDLYVTDSHTHSIRRITPSGRVETIAGNGTLGTATGPGTSARFNFPAGITLGPDGRLYVADNENHRIVAIQLGLSAPSVASQPTDLGLALGESQNLTVSSLGTTELRYQWRKGGATILGATNAVLGIVTAQLGDAGLYDVIITNSFGSVTSRLAVVTIKPQITSQTGDMIANVGGSASFAATVTGTALLSYQWRKDGINVVGATNAILSLTNLQTNQAGGYNVVVTNTAGSVTSSVVTLTVNRLSQTINFGSLVGKRVDSAPFGLNATASSGLSVSYSSGNPLVATVNGSTVTIVGIGNAAITANQIGNATYLGAASVSQTLTVTGIPPGITQQPTNLVVNATFNAMFNVAATGTAALSYQWCKDGGNLPGATDATLPLNSVQTNQAGDYSVVITNAWGSITSSVAALTVNRLGQAITFGSLATKLVGDTAFTLAATASSALPVSYSSATPAVATVSGNTVTIVGSGSAVITASQAGNAIYSAATSVNQTLTVNTPAVGGFATRQLPAGYSPAVKFTVSILAVPTLGTTVYAVEDTPPSGWAVGLVNSGGAYDLLNGKVKFGPFFDNTARTLTYELTPATNATGTVNFSGVASADGANTTVQGPDALDFVPRLPADNNPADNRITIGEVTAYGSAWKAGATWPLAPNPIPIGYVTRAGALWKGGETYRFDPAVVNAPLWWVNTGTLAPQSVGAAHKTIASLAASTATVMVSGAYSSGKLVPVAVSVVPTVGVSSYAVQLGVPMGWTISPGSITDGGTLDGVNGLVKFGPYFDNLARTVHLALLPGASSAGTVSLSGIASFDGVDIPFAAMRLLERRPLAQSDANLGRDIQRDGFRLLIQAEAGREVVLEYRDDLRASTPWIPLLTNSVGSADVVLVDPNAGQRSGRFYRIIER